MTLNLTRALAGAAMVLFLSLLACFGGSRTEGVTPLQAHMYAHYDQAGHVHHSLMNGDLHEAQESAEWIATHPELHSLPPGTTDHDEQVRAFARQVRESRDLQQAAVAAARMGSSCGECHWQEHVDPRFLMGTAPPGGEGPKAEMARHVWAADRMWIGLLGPSDAAWMEGATEFQGGWLNTQELLVDPSDRGKIRDLVQHVYALGARAKEAESAEDRAQVYGEFLTTCTNCHRLTMVEIGER